VFISILSAGATSADVARFLGVGVGLIAGLRPSVMAFDFVALSSLSMSSARGSKENPAGYPAGAGVPAPEFLGHEHEKAQTQHTNKYTLARPSALGR
jgi:hypothetical protein